MKLMADVRKADRRLTQRAAGRIPPGIGRLLSAVEETAESSKMWCGAAAVMAAFGGRRGHRSAVLGLAALAVAQLASNGVGKRLADRPRPPARGVSQRG
ncbi:hypothetical protein [Streptomyces sp. LN245]|uniref:hypothetical protein n=1 Tax=Streptomyces sp. LN245 TaxID=3112975 RepID=UPI00371E2438